MSSDSKIWAWQFDIFRHFFI